MSINRSSGGGSLGVTGMLTCSAHFRPVSTRAGKNGEFHTFVVESPVFSHALAVRTGELVERDGFGFIDLLPG